MPRVFDAQSLVELPFLTASPAAAIGTSLLASAHAEKKLAANVAQALASLETATQALHAALRPTLVTAAPADAEPAGPSPLQEEARAWSGCESWLSGLKRLPMASDKKAMAERLHTALFPSGLLFLRQTAAARWTATQSRLDMIDGEKLVADFERLGGSDVLKALREAHKAAGASAGITAPVADEEPPQLRSSLNGFRAALRCYVLQVAANAALDPSGPTGKVASRLLAPLAEYEPPPRARPTKKDKSQDGGKDGAGKAPPEPPATAPAGGKPATE